MAAGSATRPAVLRVPRGGRGAGTLEQRTAGPDLVEHRVRQVRLEEYIAEQHLPPPDFVKVDTEGFEAECLRGLEGTLAARHPALFLEMHGSSDEEKLEKAREVLAILARHGYDALHVETGTPLGDGNAEVARRGHVFASFGVLARAGEGSRLP